MHRTITSDDVKKYSTGARMRDVQLEKEEDIEYRSGHLYHSSGSTTVKMAKPRQRFTSRHTTLQEGPLNDELLSANGTYVLDRLRCYRVSSNKRGRRSARNPMIRGSLEIVVDKGNFPLLNHWDSCVVEWLLNCNAHIIVSAGSDAKAEMEDLRKSMPSIPDVLKELHTNPNNNKLSMFQILIVTINHWPAVHLMNEYILVAGNQLERLLILESEFGALPEFTPALDAVINFLTTVRSTIIRL